MIIDNFKNKEDVVAIVTRPDGTIQVTTSEVTNLWHRFLIWLGFEKPKNYNVLAIVQDKYGKIKSIVKGTNIVGNVGDIYYAEMGCSEGPTNAFANCFLGTSVVAESKDDDWSDLTFIASSEKAPTATYPMTDDQDADNSGKAVDSITYKYEWTAGDFNDAAIGCGAIAVAAASGTDPILTRWKFAAAFPKTASDTLKLYVNHNMLGV